MNPVTLGQQRFDRHMKQAAKWTMGSLKNKTAQALQKAIRAEAAAFVGNVAVIFQGAMQTVHSPLGHCVCVTCGAVKPWDGNNVFGDDGIDAGHFLASRCNSILFAEVGIHPQCTHCNRTGGRPEEYERYMRFKFGQDTIDELRFNKNAVVVQFTKADLVEKRIGYLDRIKAAEVRLHNHAMSPEPESENMATATKKKKAATKKKTGKRSLRKKSTAAKPNNRPQALPTMEDEFAVPEEIQDKADAYAAASNAKGKASGKFNTAKANLIDAMKENGIERVRVLTDLGEKIVEHELADKLKFKKPTAKKPEDEE